MRPFLVIVSGVGFGFFVAFITLFLASRYEEWFEDFFDSFDEWAKNVGRRK